MIFEACVRHLDHFSTLFFDPTNFTINDDEIIIRDSHEG